MAVRSKLKECSKKARVDTALSHVRSDKSHAAETSEIQKASVAAKNSGGKTIRAANALGKRTGRIANISARNSRTVLHTCKDIGNSAASDAAFGAVVSCAESALANFSKVQDGELSVGKFAATVARDAASAAATKAVKTAAALSIKEGGKALARQVGSTSLKRLAGSNAATAAAFGLVDVGKDAFDLACGKISGAEFGKRTVGTVGGTAGGLGGAAGGAFLGSILCPGIGTAIGGFIGSMTGGLGGRSIGDAIGKFFFG